MRFLFILASLFTLGLHINAYAQTDYNVTIDSPYSGTVWLTDPERAHVSEALELDLLRIRSDAVSHTIEMKLVTDSSLNILAFRYFSDPKDTHDIQVAHLPNGVVLQKEGKFEVAKILSKNLNPISGGDIHFIYLSNGITNSHKTFPMQLVRLDNRWVLRVNERGNSREFSSMFLKKKTLLGKTIGIEKVTVE